MLINIIPIVPTCYAGINTSSVWFNKYTTNWPFNISRINAGMHDFRMVDINFQCAPEWNLILVFPTYLQKR